MYLLHAAGAGASGVEKSLQHRLLRNVLDRPAPDVAPHLIVEAAVTLSLGSMSHPHRRCKKPAGWLQEGEDDGSLQQQLDALARGAPPASFRLNK